MRIADNQGRYAFDQQPEICKWNLGKLAEQLAHLIPPEDAQSVLDQYEQLYTAHYMAKMRKKASQPYLGHSQKTVYQFRDMETQQ